MSHHQIASTFGYKLFNADTIDDLTLEQYNILVELWNSKAEVKVEKIDRYTTRIETVEGKKGIDYGDD